MTDKANPALSKLQENDNRAKRKFVPNIKKALNKQVVVDDRPAKVPRKDERSPNTPKNQSNRASRDQSRSGSKFVQSYSIFETGIGCVVKQEKNAVELRESRPSSSATSTETHELDTTELKDEMFETHTNFISDIKQIFQDPPVLMSDSAAGVQSPVDPLKDMDLSNGRNYRVPYDFFTESGGGRLFCIQLPNQIIPADLDQLEGGRFGKIQVLDNQQVRLVIGEAVFDLVSPHNMTYSSDVVLLEQKNDTLKLNCLGHMDQYIVAAPNLDEFVRLGR